MERPGRETSRLQNDVVRRIDDFQRRGLLIPKMADHYKKAIQKARGNPIKFKVFLKQVMEDLDRMDNESGPPRLQGGGGGNSPTSSAVSSSGTSTSVSAFTEVASAASSNTSSVFLNKHTIPNMSRTGDNRMGGNTGGFQRQTTGGKLWLAQKQAVAQANRHFGNQRTVTAGLAGVSENRELQVARKSNTLSDKARHVMHQQAPMIVNVAESSSESVKGEQLQELFVEMCFFARLGYVQPPCCLRCTYREALMDKNENSNCSRWVIWRKDTSQLLHPLEMTGNLLMVQCRAARRLLAGEIVNGHRWSAEQQGIHSIGT